MELALELPFDLPIECTPKQARQVFDIKIYDWKKHLRDKAFKTSNHDLLRENDNSNIETFRSGASSRSDFIGYKEAGISAIGICVTDSSSIVLNLAAQHVNEGGKVFADSGAFRNFNESLKYDNVKPLVFQKIFMSYYQIIEQTHQRCRSNLFVSAPDVVGRQDVSFDLLVKFTDDVEAIAKTGVTVIVPLQKGELPLDEYYLKCKELLTFDFVAGLPSNAKALSRDEIFSFIKKCKPPAVHFLGCSENTLAHQAKFNSPQTSITCDATKLRKHIGKGRILTEMQTQITEECVGNARCGSNHYNVKMQHLDETDVLGDLLNFVDGLSASQTKNLALHLNVTPSDFTRFDENDELWEFLDFHNFGHATHYFLDFYNNHLFKQVSPKVRVQVVSTLAKHDIV